jgi:eukaryotic-like serine/threonine-protein kinase
MFEREARLHAAVTHDNVVTVFHAGADDRGEPYLAMEYIEGVDGYRLLRRLRQEDEVLPVGIAVHIAREVLRALESVHAARDPTSGGLLGIVHRDVSPSNVYLSNSGTVKLGDFGIARSTTRTTLRSEAGQVLKGKFAYLAPEQVAGEPSDHRADLFSLATVFAEILLNRPLFPGGGQLAILLAIRDCNIDALEEIRDRLPPGLLEVLRRALSRDPKARYATAREFAEALAPFAPDPRIATKEIAARVRWVQAASSGDQMAAVRDSVKMMRAARSGPPSRPPARSAAKSGAPGTKEVPEDKTEEFQPLPSWVLRADGERLGPWTFARLMEAVATGQLQRGDQVDFVGRGFFPVEEIEEFSRFFPTATAATHQVTGPGAPDFCDGIGATPMLQTLMRVLAQRETGVLFAERTDETGAGKRKELYFVGGKLHHVASSNASELLGEYLVGRGKLEREELDLALAVLPRYGGRMGDTLISMGLVGPVDIFRAIREQGRDRVADLFLWRDGQVSFYRGQTAPHVEFPLDLELSHLMLAGLEVAKPGDSLFEAYRARLDNKLLPSSGSDDLFSLEAIAWPPVVERVRSLVERPTPLRDLLKVARQGGDLTAGDVLRALEVLLAGGLLAWSE